MTYSTGKLLFLLIVAVLLSCLAAWVIAYRYRNVMQRLMRAPVMPAGSAATAIPAVVAPPASAALADNRRAGWHLTLLLIVLSCLMALCGAGIWMMLAFPGESVPPKRLAAVALLHLWPVIPALGLIWRWSRKRIFAVLALWCVACFLILLWRSIEPRPLQLMVAMANEIGPSLVLVALILMGGATRAIAPWLLLPFTGLGWASMFGIDVLALLVERESALVMSLPSWLGAYTVFALFALAPWLIAWWPLRRLGRLLGQAYARKWLSELMVVFATVWAFTLLEKALTVASSAGVAAVAMFLPLLWIPLGLRLYRPRAKLHSRPPTLLVLRVFQRDAQAEELFDQVIERWRLSGNVVMIAGTDLALRTLDADDIFTFLDGRLEERFIRAPGEVAARIESFDMAPDADRRWRINKCYCHDTTWQQALHALVERSDVVLMDLRGFHSRNEGCRYELRTLAKVARELHVVVLCDTDTDRRAAEEELSRGRADRFVWIDTSSIVARKRRELLVKLFETRTQAPNPA